MSAVAARRTGGALLEIVGGDPIVGINAPTMPARRKAYSRRTCASDALRGADQ
jgi:hypothetical protein